jgi:hypothetical protein
MEGCVADGIRRSASSGLLACLGQLEVKGPQALDEEHTVGGLVASRDVAVIPPGCMKYDPGPSRNSGFPSGLECRSPTGSRPSCREYGCAEERRNRPGAGRVRRTHRPRDCPTDRRPCSRHAGIEISPLETVGRHHDESGCCIRRVLRHGRAGSAKVIVKVRR